MFVKVASNPQAVNGVTLGNTYGSTNTQILPTISIGPQSTISGSSEIDFDVRTVAFSEIADAFRRAYVEDLMSLINSLSNAKIDEDGEMKNNHNKIIVAYIADQLKEASLIDWDKIKSTANKIVNGDYDADPVMTESTCPKSGRTTTPTVALQPQGLAGIVPTSENGLGNDFHASTRSFVVDGESVFFGTTSPSADGGVAWDYRGWITKFRSRPRGSGRPQVLIFLVEPRKVAGEWRPAQLRDVRLVAPKLLNLESILDDWH